MRHADWRPLAPAVDVRDIPAAAAASYAVVDAVRVGDWHDTYLLQHDVIRLLVINLLRPPAEHWQFQWLTDHPGLHFTRYWMWTSGYRNNRLNFCQRHDAVQIFTKEDSNSCNTEQKG